MSTAPVHPVTLAVESGTGGILFVKSPGLVSHRRTDLLYQFGIKSGAQTNGLRKNRGVAKPGDPVQGFGSGPKGRYAQSWYGRRILMKH